MEKSIHKTELFMFLLIAEISQRSSYVSGGGVGRVGLCSFFIKSPSAEWMLLLFYYTLKKKPLSSASSQYKKREQILLSHSVILHIFKALYKYLPGSWLSTPVFRFPGYCFYFGGLFVMTAWPSWKNSFNIWELIPSRTTSENAIFSG